MFRSIRCVGKCNKYTLNYSNIIYKYEWERNFLAFLSVKFWEKENLTNLICKINTILRVYAHIIFAIKKEIKFIYIYMIDLFLIANKIAR